jgi:putative ABC transport system permease protein
MSRPLRGLRRYGAAVGSILLRLRTQRLLALLMVGLVLVTATIFAAIPRLYDRVADDALRYQLKTAPPALVNLAMLEQYAPAVRGDEAIDPVAQEGQDFAGRLPVALRQLIATQEFLLESPEFVAEPTSGEPLRFPLFLRLRYQSNADPHVTLLEGRLPRTAASTIAVPPWMPGLHLGSGATGPVPVIEVAISAETAASDDLKVGQRFVGGLPRLRSPSATGDIPVVVEIVGIFDIPNPNAPFWYADVNLQRPTITGTADAQQVHATVLLATGGYGALTGEQIVFRYEWHYFFDAGRTDAGALDPLLDAVREVKAQYPAFLGALGSGTAVRTGLDEVVGSYLGQRRISVAILAVVIVGLGAMALIVLGLFAALLADRRRAATVLQRGRGASPGQIVGAEVAEGLLLAAPPAILAAVAAALVVPARANGASPLAAAFVALAAILLLAGAVLPLARRSLGQLERPDTGIAAVSRRRLVFEGFVVVLAVVGIVMLRRRGLSATGPGSADAGFDPFLAAVPVLLGVAVGLVVLRLFPFPVRGAAWLGSLGRGFVTVFALRRVGRAGGVAHLPLLVLLLTIGLGSFSSVILATIDRGQTLTAWQEVGADYRIAAPVFGRLPAGFSVTSVGGVTGEARAHLVPNVTFDMPNVTASSVILDAVETDALQSVTAGTPAEPRLPLALLAESPAQRPSGTAETPIPALVSKRAALGNHVMTAGDRFQLLVDGTWTSFEVAEARDTFPGIAPGSAFVVVSFDQLQASRPTRPLDVTALFVAADGSAGKGLGEAVATIQAPRPHLSARADVLATLRGAPLVAAVAAGFNLGLVVAALYAALAVAVALVLTSAARARDLTFLRTLGLSQRQTLALTVVEHLPALLAAILVGVALGIGLAILLEPGLDLRAFAGGQLSVPLTIDWAAIALLAGSLVAVVAIALAVSAGVARRLSLARALRLGDER